MTVDKKKEEISSRQHHILLGALLGDAHCRKSSSKNRKCRIQISHSMKQHSYLLWKREELSALCTKTRQPYQYSRSSGAQECTFYTNYQENLNTYHSLFYRRDVSGGYKKHVPAQLPQLLRDPLSLLVWYLDDGTLRNDCDSCRIATQGFSREEQELLSTVLRDNFGVGSKVERWGAGGLVVPAEEFGIFRELLLPLCRLECEDMLYKFIRKPLND